MSKTALAKPVLICLYGVPGSGKSFVARSLSTVLPIAHVSADRIRAQLFANPRFDAQENSIVSHLMNYVTEEFLNAGVSVAYDALTPKAATRRRLRDIARKHKAEFLVVWLQVDAETAFARTQKRDHRTADDKDAQEHSRETFTQAVQEMQNPRDENYMVISGKHAFSTQKSAIVNRLYQMGLVESGTVQRTVTKPGLINLIPTTPPSEANEPAENYRNITVF